MKNTVMCLMVFICSVCVFAQEPASEKTNAPNYGQAVVASILRLDENITFYCDIQELPPVVGKDMPVKLKSLKPSTSQENLKILIFLNDMLFSKDKPVKNIILKEIQRGQSFCLMANIEVDGKDLADLLVENNLARKVIEVATEKTSLQTLSTQPTEKQSIEDNESTSEAVQVQDVSYVCSKSSKIFHLSTCSHAKKMDQTRSITFNTKDDAVSSGRRPCKVCKP